ncbi:MAG: hypothetical protein ACOYOB_17305 [Myxococcota bacterium]
MTRICRPNENSTGRLALWLGACLIAAIACSETPDTDVPTAAPDPALLDHAGPPSLSCAVTRGAQELQAPGMVHTGHAVTATPTGFLLSQCAVAWKANTGVHGVSIVPAAADGTLGVPVGVTVDKNDQAADCIATASGEGAGVAWRQEASSSNSSTIHVGSVDATGSWTVGPSPVASIDPIPSGAGGLHQVVANGADLAVLWSDGAGLWLGEFAASGAQKGNPILLTSLAVQDARVVRTDSGWIASWGQPGADDSSDVFSIHVAGTDTPPQAPVRISRPSSATRQTRNGDLIHHHGTTLAAMEEWVTRGDVTWTGRPGGTWATPPNGSRESVVRLVALDKDGAPIGPSRPVQVAVPHVENVQPVLHAMGDDVALVWSTGSVIYRCGGCISNNDLRLVVLRRGDLAPLSPVAEVPRVGENGLKRPHFAFHGDVSLLAFSVDYHATSRVGTAVVACVAK